MVKLADAPTPEVPVSQMVKDLVTGSGISFEDRGPAELKGVPGQWRLYSVADGTGLKAHAWTSGGS